MPTVHRKIFTEETEDELLHLTRDEVTLYLTDKQRTFCEHYIKNHNIKIAAINAGYSTRSAHIVGWKLRQDENVNRYIAWLKLLVGRECHIRAVDFIDQYIRIAFSDITDFVTVEEGKLRLTDSSKVDGQLISKIRSGKDGISVELVDKLKALEKLEHYFDVMPKDWRQRIEERKLELASQKLELEKLRAGQGIDEEVDDGFIEALKESAQQVWGEEEGLVDISDEPAE